MATVTQSTAYTAYLKAYLASDHLSPATGKTLAVKLLKSGGSFADPHAGASNATEDANGWYHFPLDTTDTNTLGDLVVRLTGSGVDDAERLLQVVSAASGGTSGSGSSSSAAGRAPGTLGEVLGVSIAKSGNTVAGLVLGQGGLPVTQASLASIAYAVTRTNADGTKTTTGSGTLTVAAVVFDTPVTTDPRYTRPGGYSFLATLPASAFQVGGLKHRIAVTFTPVSGEPFVQVWSTSPISDT